MVFVKNWKIIHLSILDKTSENNTFHDILEGKNRAIYTRKTKTRLKCKTRLIFPRINGPNVYLHNKNKKLQKSKN